MLSFVDSLRETRGAGFTGSHGPMNGCRRQYVLIIDYRLSNVLRRKEKSALPDLNGGQVDLQSTALPD